MLDLIGELGVEGLFGVVGSIGGRLEEMGIRFVKDIRGMMRERLVSVLGLKMGERLWDYVRGVDRSELGE